MSETMKDVAEMEAGRAMDVLVAERVMGFAWRDVRLRGETNTVHVLLHPSVGDIDGMYDRASLRHPRYAEYSTEIADAWEVVGKLMADHSMVSVNVSDVSGWWCVIYPPDGAPIESEWSETAPLAICRAALASLDAA